ncbi:hypothetical protein OC846_005685 [Tilletia horrida]|uniref:Uncharacterized protein n=1 Tax=Tilletia horrida TaxID=155126 RepID=A0AAN6JPN7_9BASI|nr:hypothetical protein OC845_006654 [Tilletia horrida]KAK0545395.1 hypothetical protein OC846_005685 [Tilletia horrida]
MTTPQTKPSPRTGPAFAASNLESKFDALSQQVQRSLREQERHFKAQTKEWEHARQQMEQVIDAQTQTLKIQTEILERFELEAQQQHDGTALLASQIASSGTVPRDSFEWQEHRLLWSHLQKTFAAEPVVFSTDERKRAFALAHLNLDWRSRYGYYLRNRHLSDDWWTLSDYILNGRGRH